MTSIWSIAQAHPWFGIIYLVGLMYILVQLIQLYYLIGYKAKFENPPSEWPMISIWVAARNEAENIGDCLSALVNMDYPKEKLLN